MSFLELTVEEPSLTIAPTVELFGSSADDESPAERDEIHAQQETATESEFAAGNETLSATGLLGLLGVLAGIGVVVWLTRRRRS